MRELSANFVCREQNGVVWLVTPYRLPDGDLIELIVTSDNSGQFTVTDAGETARYLANHGFDPTASPGAKRVMAEIAARTGVEPALPEIRKTAPAPKLGEALFDVILACLALGDTLYLSRAYQPTRFVEEVARMLMEAKFVCTRDKRVVGSSGRSYKVHFSITVYEDGVPHGEALLHTLTARAPAQAKPVVDAATRMWFDIGNSKWHGTVLDDRFLGWPTEDVRLLGRLTKVYLWSEREELLKELTAITKQPRRSP